MFIGILNIAAAIILSLVSAYFSITGIQTIFAGAAVGAMLMGAALEFSKITATIWLHSWWKKSSKLLKYYLVFSVTVLILISSIGIYGFLAKAYVGQQGPAIQLQTRIDRIEQSIAREELDIGRAQQGLDVLDESIAIYFDYDNATRGLEQREAQSEDREHLLGQIDEGLDTIAELQDQRFDIVQQINELETNVGPIKYLAAIIFGEDNAESNYDNAARIFILLLVLVFDPFAVLMMVSGNIAIDEHNEKKTRKKPGPKPGTKKKKTASKKSEPTTTTKELPMEPEKKRKVVEVDMSNYVDPDEIKRLKEQTEHTRKRRRPVDS